LWLSLALGGTLLALIVLLAAPAVVLMGGSGATAGMAFSYPRISALGVPFAMVALGGQGFLRGVGSLRTPLLILVAANAANAVLEVLFVYGLGWGLAGSAWGTVIAQAGMGAAFVLWLLRAPADSRRPSWTTMRHLLRVVGDTAVRTGGSGSLFCARERGRRPDWGSPADDSQGAFGLFVFFALVLDARAVAGQILVGRFLGAGDAQGAYAAGRKILWSVVVSWVFCLALLAGTGAIPRLFTGDPDVVERAGDLWPLPALMQPMGAAVFALDGILIGASDTRFLKWSTVAAFLAFAPWPSPRSPSTCRRGGLGSPERPDARASCDLWRAFPRPPLGRRWAVVGATT
jgi:putative MATE family efflux protein